ncbi:MAG: hypothetical protein DI622_04990 [Chryseobacterium sp.]|uniref:hypothetical protein n=1 Tax=Chryseobacterium sp. TaxID=1871047 RepID=UPI000DB241AD|nr:hypothetical protein [Chryseobacterium sp.]MPS64003.1 hypothetical protein [Chryseobacterium sp.]PZU23370.1 MAG: hypothetical protein DI622_04990 [Chryseobacterium sp.]
MKTLLCFTLFLCFNCCFGQNDIEIKILNDTIKKVSFYDRNNIVYKIINNSEKAYCLIIDSGEFNEDPEYNVEPFFIGLPDYYIYDKNSLLTPNFTTGSHSTNSIIKIDENSSEFKKFSKKNSKKFDEFDMRVAFRLSKHIIILKPKEEKVFTTLINFPNYMSRYFELQNKGTYLFQISLNNPNNAISKYFEKIVDNDKKQILVFTGQIFSNKVPLIYEVHNN